MSWESTPVESDVWKSMHAPKKLRPTSQKHACWFWPLLCNWFTPQLHSNSLLTALCLLPRAVSCLCGISGITHLSTSCVRWHWVGYRHSGPTRLFQWNSFVGTLPLDKLGSFTMIGLGFLVLFPLFILPQLTEALPSLPAFGFLLACFPGSLVLKEAFSQKWKFRPFSQPSADYQSADNFFTLLQNSVAAFLCVCMRERKLFLLIMCFCLCVGMQTADASGMTMNADWLAAVPSIPPASLFAYYKYKQQAPSHLSVLPLLKDTGHLVDTTFYLQRREKSLLQVGINLNEITSSAADISHSPSPHLYCSHACVHWSVACCYVGPNRNHKYRFQILRVLH